MKARLFPLSIALALLGGGALLAYRLFLYAPPVAVAQAKEGKVAIEVHGPGVVAARITVTVSTRVTGILKAVHADQGDSVTSGQLLAELDDTDVAAKASAAREGATASRRNIEAADAALAKARADLELAQSNFQRDQEVFRTRNISQAAMDATAAGLKSAQSAAASAAATLAARRAESDAAAQEAVYAGVLHAFTRITAPMDGLVVAREAEAGNTLVPGSPIFRLVDTDTLWVAARIDESVVGRAEVGQPAAIQLRGGQELAGEVVRISRQSDPATRELEVDVAFREPPQRFAMDQEAEVTIEAGEESGVLIPATALLQEGRERGVLVVADGRAVFRPVQTGATDGKRVVVREGIEVGEMVIRRPADPKAKVSAGSRVRPVTGGDR
ncbi:MAG: efflux RND transporter periplasmic adaptor subunit [Chromatiaceae bacterium]|nr:efflux RND transporter periplasmic adaptor subunit [Chromatiaceae bacterium]MBP8288236.1 efflux RND transporter periplasmic adaptor subunit [Chromatiaceae bacterium]MBP9756121.1 efflux RND transporter periplasmic adaptor subunit [Phenylobacterium sp.]